MVDFFLYMFLKFRGDWSVCCSIVHNVLDFLVFRYLSLGDQIISFPKQWCKGLDDLEFEPMAWAAMELNLFFGQYLVSENWLFFGTVPGPCLIESRISLSNGSKCWLSLCYFSIWITFLFEAFLRRLKYCPFSGFADYCEAFCFKWLSYPS